MDSCASSSSSSVSTLDTLVNPNPLDPLSPANSGYYSPIGSDTLQTPFIEGHEGSREVICVDPREPEASIYDYMDSPAYNRSHPIRSSPKYTLGSSRVLSSPTSAAPRYRSFSSLSLAPGSAECSTGRDSEENLFDISFGSEFLEDDLQLACDMDKSPRQETIRLASFRHPSYNCDAHIHCRHFPKGHQLNTQFVEHYALEDELGAGGYGFVMTAYHRDRGYEVAIKFIIKDKVSDGSWMVDDVLGKLPTEVLLLCFIDHDNIVKCLDLYEDEMYYYMVQELHGSPWSNPWNPRAQLLHPALKHSDSDKGGCVDSNDHNVTGQQALQRPDFPRRPSHDLFECIEQSEHKRLTEEQARYVFRQVVDAVHYLDVQGVSHRDLKDENIVIDRSFKVKLIDFGSAVVVDPSKPRPFYDVFFGTTAYAASEILQKKPYQAPPAEVWTLGVLLSYLLTGMSPFATMRDAIEGNIAFCSSAKQLIPSGAMELMQRCLVPDPMHRATIVEVKDHQWLKEP